MSDIEMARSHCIAILIKLLKGLKLLSSLQNWAKKHVRNVCHTGH